MSEGLAKGLLKSIVVGVPKEYDRGSCNRNRIMASPVKENEKDKICGAK